MTRAKLDAFVAAARDLGVVAVNYLAPEHESGRPIVSIDAGSRDAAVTVAAALGMPAPREVDWNGALWLSSSVVEPGLCFNVRSAPEPIAEPTTDDCTTCGAVHTDVDCFGATIGGES